MSIARDHTLPIVALAFDIAAAIKGEVRAIPGAQHAPAATVITNGERFLFWLSGTFGGVITVTLEMVYADHERIAEASRRPLVAINQAVDALASMLHDASGLADLHGRPLHADRLRTLRAHIITAEKGGRLVTR